MRLTSYLAQQRVDFELLYHPPAFSASRLAKYLRLPGSQVAKTLLLRGAGSFVVAVLPSTHQVDPGLLAAVLGGSVRLATTQEMGERLRDWELGRMSPFGGLCGLATLLDDSIPADSSLVFEGQTCVEALRMRCGDYERLEKPRRLTFARKQLPLAKSQPAQPLFSDSPFSSNCGNNGCR